MARQKVSRKRALISSFIFFLIGVFILTFLHQYWWPGVALLVGIPLALYQFLMGRKYDMAISLFLYIGIFVTIQFQIPWKMLLPILFVFGGVYIFLREIFKTSKEDEIDREKELNKEIEEEKK